MSEEKLIRKKLCSNSSFDNSIIIGGFEIHYSIPIEVLEYWCDQYEKYQDKLDEDDKFYKKFYYPKEIKAFIVKTDFAVYGTDYLKLRDVNAMVMLESNLDLYVNLELTDIKAIAAKDKQLTVQVIIPKHILKDYLYEKL